LIVRQNSGILNVSIKKGTQGAQMTQKEIKAQLRSLKSYAKKATKTKESSRKALQKAGILTKSGRLAKPYR
jgi:hypothetical protein